MVCSILPLISNRQIDNQANLKQKKIAKFCRYLRIIYPGFFLVKVGTATAAPFTAATSATDIAPTTSAAATEAKDIKLDLSGNDKLNQNIPCLNVYRM